MPKIYGIDSRTHPHLYFVVAHFSAENGKGNCFHRSAALCLDEPNTEIVMATFRGAEPHERMKDPRMSAVPFIHCWVEGYTKHGRVALAPTTIERVGELVTMPAKAYHEVNEARDFYTLSRKDLLKLSGELGISAYLRGKGKEIKGFGGVLLNAAGVPHEITKEGGVVPPGSPEAGKDET